ncbi:MAG: C10 family peptidase [Prevotella sp.]
MTFGNERSESEMRSIAVQQIGKSAKHMQTKAMKNFNTGNYQLRKTFDNSALVAYVADGVGTVFVSKNDNCRPVLGYTAAVVTELDEMPCAFKWWLGEMESQLRASEQQAETKTGATNMSIKEAETVTYKVVDPMITTKWGQSNPFNSLCPDSKGTSGLTGCTATQIAQILNYWRYPQSATFDSFCYIYETATSEDMTKLPVSVSSTYTYPMLDAYGYYSVDGSRINIGNSSYDVNEATNVATLMRDCAYSVCSSFYGKEGTLANSVLTPYALVNYFGYPVTSIKYLDREYYTDNEWHAYIYGELAKGSPIAYCGNDTEQGGHAFVVHGVDADGLVAVNWGWLGLADGYYAMDLMSSSEATFNTYHRATIGIRPTALSDDVASSSWVAPGWNVTLSEEISMVDRSTVQNIDIDLSGGLFNVALKSFVGYVVLYIYDATDKKYVDGYSIIQGTEADPYEYNHGVVGTLSLPPSAYKEAITNGHKYYIMLMSFSDEEEAKNDFNFVRTEGGIVFYAFDVDATGKLTMSDKVYEEELPTSINSVETGVNNLKVNKRYNIMGQPVGNKFKGLIIENGVKKVIK